MGYSTSVYTLIKLEPELLPLASGKTLQWSRPETEGQGWVSTKSYKIREALSIALLYPERFPALAKVAPFVTVKILSSRVVEARVSIRVADTPVVSEPQAAHVSHPHQHADFIIAAMEDEKQIAAEWEGSGSAHYDRTKLSLDQLLWLARWADAQTPKLMVLYVARTTSLTIALDDPEVPAESKVQP